MEWQVVLALVLGIPVILFPAAYVWYLTIGGIRELVGQKRGEKATQIVKG